MIETSKTCPDCKSPMKLDEREKPQGGAMFIGPNRWICTNEICGKVIEIEGLS